MTDIETIRVLIGDQVQYSRAVAQGDGATTQFQLPNYPVVDGSQEVSIDGGAQTEGTDYSIDNEVGLVTTTSPVADTHELVTTYKHTLLSDDALQAMMDLNEGDVLDSAADALDSIAVNQVLIQKKIKLLDLQTDGPAMAEALKKRATELRNQAVEVPAFDFIEQVNNLAGFGEKIIKDWMRSS